jgi:uncharacterized protein YlxP (DUF503 family)|uniref:DUF503 domain-containing protein n=1 Tax=Desulfomonile tiedjei TaxID=2358 RepID=A0A7C4ARR7_9BACT
MVVGIGNITLHIHQSRSLKAKRQVVKSILGRCRSKFDISMAEVDNQDKWQLCSLGFAVVSNDAVHADQMIQTVFGFVEGLHLAEVIDSRSELIHY